MLGSLMLLQRIKLSVFLKLRWKAVPSHSR